MAPPPVGGGCGPERTGPPSGTSCPSVPICTGAILQRRWRSSLRRRASKAAAETCCCRSPSPVEPRSRRPITASWFLCTHSISPRCRGIRKHTNLRKWLRERLTSPRPPSLQGTRAAWWEGKPGPDLWGVAPGFRAPLGLGVMLNAYYSNSKTWLY